MPAKRIDSGKLLALIRAVEAKHGGSVITATPEEMAPIWEMVKIPVRTGRHRIQVTQPQYWVIENYSRVPTHTSLQTTAALHQLGHSYDWLNRRVHEYRMGILEVEDEAQN